VKPVKPKESTVDVIKSQISLEARKDFLLSLSKYLSDDFGADIGEFEAEDILDFFCKEIGPVFYNCGVKNAREFVVQRLTDAMDDSVQIEIKAEDKR
jgi:uncharacterized protein (DUF2164 family)